MPDVNFEVCYALEHQAIQYIGAASVLDVFVVLIVAFVAAYTYESAKVDEVRRIPLGTFFGWFFPLLVLYYFAMGMGAMRVCRMVFPSG